MASKIFGKRCWRPTPRINVALVAFNNLVGGQDELVFDGNSLILNEKGEVVARGRQFAEDLVTADLDVEAVFRARLHDPQWRKEVLPKEEGQRAKIVVSETPFPAPKPPLPPRQMESREPREEVYEALILGTRDYVRKNGSEKVVVSISGGIDSSLVATIAVDALGVANVVGVTMPSPYSSPASKSDAKSWPGTWGLSSYRSH